MRVRIFISSGKEYELEARDGADRECLALPKDADRFAFWRKATGDERITGHAMVWQLA